MKLHLPLRLLSALLAVIGMASTQAAATTYTPGSDLGTVMYVGDSITHGVGAGSYRWALFKILTDNGITQDEVGVKTGNHSGGPGVNVTYGSATFENVHSSQASARAWEIAGRASGGRFDNSNIQNWLGQSTVKNNGATYTGATFTGEDTPDTFFLLIGTNDLLSDSGGVTSTKIANLLGTCTDGVWSGTGDMDTIVDSMHTANSNADVIILNIPCWTQHANNNGADVHQAVADYNEQLEAWAAQKEGVILINVNEGMVDVASSTPFYGVSSMFYNPGSDGLHPSAQGDLIMAGNIAKQLGYAGRTAGQTRREASALALQSSAIHSAATSTGTVTLSGDSISMGAGAALSYAWGSETDLSQGYTVDFSFASGMGNGSTDGWNTTGNLTLSIGNGTTGGTLNINEAYIQWGDMVLYSTDMSALTDSLRVVYVYGNAAQNLATGYYVWLDDMLIGEGLAGTASSVDGLTITNGSGSDVTLGYLALDSSASWAPASSAYSVANPTIDPYIAPAGSGEGTIQWLTDEAAYYSFVNPAIIGSNVRSQIDSSTGAAGRVIGGVIRDGYGSSGIKVNAGTYTGDIWLTLTGTTYTNSGSWNAVNTSTLTGDAHFRFDPEYTASNAWGAIFGSANGTVNGDVYLEFSSANLIVNGGTFSNVNTAVSGSFNSNISGKVTIVVNDGTFNKSIYGGEINKPNKTVGSTAVYLNKGTFSANVYAGGTQGTISGNSELFITGDGVVTSGVTELSAGGSGGTISGNTTLTLRNITDAEGGFSTYSGKLSGHAGGTVTGTETLVLDNVNVENLQATLANFDVVQVSGGSSVGLSSLGGATELSVTESELRLTNANGEAGTSYELSSVTNMNGTIQVGSGVSLAMDYAGDQQVSGAYVVEGGSLDFKGSTTAGSVAISSGALRNAGHVNGGITVNATGDVAITNSEGSTSVQLHLDGGSVTGDALILTEGSSLQSGSVSNALSGAVAVVKDEEGTLILTGDNSYSGGTTLSAGTLLVGHANALGSGAVQLLGGSFGAASAFSTDKAVTLGAVTLGEGEHKAAITLAGATTISGVASNNVALVLSGSLALKDDSLSVLGEGVNMGTRADAGNGLEQARYTLISGGTGASLSFADGASSTTVSGYTVVAGDDGSATLYADLATGAYYVRESVVTHGSSATAGATSYVLAGGELSLPGSTTVALPLTLQAASTLSGGASTKLMGGITLAEGATGDLTIQSTATDEGSASSHGASFSISGGVDLGDHNITIASGVVNFGSGSDNNSVLSFRAGTVTVNEGAVLKYGLGTASTMDTDLTLNGGKLIVQATDPGETDKTLEVGVLSVSKASRITAYNSSNLTFEKLAGSADLTLSGGNLSTTFTTAEYTGTLVVDGAGLVKVNGGSLAEAEVKAGSLTLNGATVGSATLGNATVSALAEAAPTYSGVTLTQNGISGGSLSGAAISVTDDGVTLSDVNLAGSKLTIAADKSLAEASTFTLGTGSIINAVSGITLNAEKIGISGTVQNAGALTLTGAFAAVEGATFTQEGTSYSDGANGYVSANNYIVTNASGATVVVTEGATYGTQTLMQDAKGAYFLTQSGNDYYINVAADYDAALMGGAENIIVQKGAILSVSDSAKPGASIGITLSGGSLSMSGASYGSKTDRPTITLVSATEANTVYARNSGVYANVVGNGDLTMFSGSSTGTAEGTLYIYGTLNHAGNLTLDGHQVDVGNDYGGAGNIGNLVEDVIITSTGALLTTNSKVDNSGNLIIESGSTLEVTGGATIGNGGALLVQGGTLKLKQAGSLVSVEGETRTVDTDKEITVSGGGVIELATAYTLNNLTLDGGSARFGSEALSGTVTLGNSGVNSLIADSSAGAAFAASVTGTGDLDLTSNGGRPLNLSGSIAHQGALTVKDATSVTLMSGGSIANTTAEGATGTVNIEGTGTLTVANGATVTSTIAAGDAATLAGKGSEAASCVSVVIGTSSIISKVDPSVASSISGATITVSNDYSIGGVTLSNSQLTLSGGTLALGSTAVQNCSVTLAGGTLSADALSFGAGSTLTLAAENASLTLGALTLAGGTLELGTHVNDTALSVGNGTALTLSGKTVLTLDASLLEGETLADIVLLSGVGSVTLADATLTTGTLAGDYFTLGSEELDARLAGYTLALVNGKLCIEAPGEPGDLTWVGGSGTWNTLAANAVWDAAGTPETDDDRAFANKDNVSFSGDAAATITVEGALTAGDMTVANGAYSFASGADASLKVNTLTVEDATVTIAEGLMNFSDTAVMLKGGTLNLSGDVTLSYLESDPYSGTGTLTVSGGTLTLLNGVPEGDVTTRGTVVADALVLSGSGNYLFDSLTVDSLTALPTGALRLGDDYGPAYSSTIGRIEGSCNLALAANSTVTLGSATTLSSLRLSAGSQLLLQSQGDNGTTYHDLVVSGITVSSGGLRVPNSIVAGNLTLGAGGGTNVIGAVEVHGDLTLGGRSTSVSELDVTGDVLLRGSSMLLSVAQGSSIEGTIAAEAGSESIGLELTAAGEVSIGSLAVDLRRLTVNNYQIQGVEYAGDVQIGSAVTTAELVSSGAASLQLTSGGDSPTWYDLTVKGATDDSSLSVQANKVTLGGSSSLASLTVHGGELTLGGNLSLSGALSGVHTVNVLGTASLGSGALMEVGSYTAPGSAALAINFADKSVLTALNISTGSSYTLLDGSGYVADDIAASFSVTTMGADDKMNGNVFEDTANNKKYTLVEADGLVTLLVEVLADNKEVTWAPGSGNGEGAGVWGSGSSGSGSGSDDNWENATPPVAESVVNFTQIGGADDPEKTETVEVSGTVSSASVVVNSGKDTYTFTSSENTENKIETGTLSVQSGGAALGVDTEVSGVTVIGSPSQAEAGALSVTNNATLKTDSLNMNEEASLTVEAGASLKVENKLEAVAPDAVVTLGGSLDVGQAQIAELNLVGDTASLTVAGDTTVTSLAGSESASTVSMDTLHIASGTATVTAGTGVTELVLTNLSLGSAGQAEQPNVAGNLNWDKKLTVSESFTNYGSMDLGSNTFTLDVATDNGGSVVAKDVVLGAAESSTFTELTTTTLTLNVSGLTAGSALLTLESLTYNDGLTQTNNRAGGGITPLEDNSIELTLTGIDTVEKAAAIAAGTYTLIDADTLGSWAITDFEDTMQLFALAGSYAQVKQEGNTLQLIVTADEDRFWTGGDITGEDNWAGAIDPTTGKPMQVLNLSSITTTDGQAISDTAFDTVDVVRVDKDTVLDFADFVHQGADALAGVEDNADGLLINQLGGGTHTLTLDGNNEADAHVTLSNAAGDSDFSGTLALTEGVKVDVLGGGTLSVGATQVTDSSLTVASTGSYETDSTALSGTDARLTVEQGGSYTTGALQGNSTEGGTLSGTIIVAGTQTAEDAVYTAGYDNATVLIGSGADQTLAPDAELSIGSALEEGETGKVTLSYGDAAGTPQMGAITTAAGATVVLDNMDADGNVKTLELGADPSMTGGTLSYSVSAQEIADRLNRGEEGPAITSGAKLDLSNTTIAATQADGGTGADRVERSSFDVSKGTEGLALIKLADSGSMEGVELESLLPDTKFFKRYFENLQVKDGQLVGDLVTDYYSRDLSETANGASGLSLLDAASLKLNPQGINDDVADDPRYRDLAGVLDALDGHLATGDSAAADRLASAVAGAGVSTVGLALSDDMERQLKAIRNRTTTMGGLHGQQAPAFNAWINAEGDYRDMDADGTMAGYTVSSWGGTVGFDVAFSECFSAGLAFTAMYGDLDADAADVASADLDTYYISAFTRKSCGNWVYTCVGSIGLMDATMERTVNYGGSYTSSGDTEGLGLGLMYEVGYKMALNEDRSTILQPVVNVTWRHIEVDAYTESGSDASLRLSEQELDTLTFGLGARLQTTVGEQTFNHAMLLEARALAKLDAGDRESAVSSTLVNAASTSAQMRSAELNVFGVELGAGLTIPLGAESGALFTDASVELRGDYSNVNATFGYKLSF